MPRVALECFVARSVEVETTPLTASGYACKAMSPIQGTSRLLCHGTPIFTLTTALTNSICSCLLACGNPHGRYWSALVRRVSSLRLHDPFYEATALSSVDSLFSTVSTTTPYCVYLYLVVYIVVSVHVLAAAVRI
ncbi:hypothetical protein BR93DRAFT_925053, partial [Coniochaeta sp. PMI_546]